MTATILDGRATAAVIRAELRRRVTQLGARGILPGLGTILVGQDAGSQAYVRGKHRSCAEVGIASISVELPATASTADVAAAVDRLNGDPACTGFIIQLPLPPDVDAGALLAAVDPAKDADGLHPVNLGRLVLGEPGPLPCTPRACVELLRRYQVPLTGAEIVVIGRGVTVGRPLALVLSRRGIDATVTSCHTRTRNLAAHTCRADIVVAAAGVAGMLTADMVRPGATVLDVGITRTATGLVGDVAAPVRDVVARLAPMPGGIGPMTVAMLLSTVVEAAEHSTPAAAER